MRIMQEQWEDELERFSKRLAIPKPQLIFGKLWWCPPSWPQFGAAASINKIMVSKTIRDHPEAPRLYLLSHELGHIKAKHTILYLGVAVPASCLAYLLLGLTALPWNVKASIVSLCLAIGGAVWVRFREYAADAISARLIGVEGTLGGMNTMRRISGRKESREEKRRAAHLLELQKCGRIVPYR